MYRRAGELYIAGATAKTDAKPVIWANSTSNAEYESSKSKYDGDNNQIVHTSLYEGFRTLRTRGFWAGWAARSEAKYFVTGDENELLSQVTKIISVIGDEK